MNALYEDLPTTVQYEGKAYPIITDFREWVRFIELVQDDNVPKYEKAQLLLKWYENEIPDDTAQAIELLRSFVCMEGIPRAGKEISPEQERKLQHKLRNNPTIDYSYDAPCIISAFQECYEIDLTTIEYMHWWRFRFLLDNVNKDTELAFRRSYRSIELKDIKDKKERIRVKKIKDSIALPVKKEALNDYDIGSAFA